MNAAATLAQFDHIVQGTRAILAAVPDDRLGWRPHARSWTLGELATHLANLPSWAAGTLQASELDLAPPGGGGPPPLAPLASADELVAALDASAAAARKAIDAASDEDLLAPWSLLVGGETRFTLPKGAVLRGFVLDHMIHHRAQLGVCLRLLDVPVPQTFGPTADFPDM